MELTLMDIQKHDNILHNLKIIMDQLDQEWLETLLEHYQHTKIL